MLERNANVDVSLDVPAEWRHESAKIIDLLPRILYYIYVRSMGVYRRELRLYYMSSTKRLDHSAFLCWIRCMARNCIGAHLKPILSE